MNVAFTFTGKPLYLLKLRLQDTPKMIPVMKNILLMIFKKGCKCSWQLKKNYLVQWLITLLLHRNATPKIIIEDEQ